MHLADSSSGLGGLFSALGVNLPALLFDASAFLIFTWLMGKYVFPVLTKAIDDKRAELIATTAFKHAAEAKLAEAEAAAEKIVASARTTADQAISDAHGQAEALLTEARNKAQVHAARILDGAREQLDQDITSARQSLKHDLAKLVAAETASLLGREISAAIDYKLIGQATGDSAK